MVVYRDHREDPSAWARELGVSDEAVRLLLDADFIDLHCDLEVPVRLLGYDPLKRHRPFRWFFGHTDYPRLLEAGFTGIVADIATNVFRPAGGRQAVTLRNLERVKARIEAHPKELCLVRTRSEYDRARAAGRMALWLALQGGNALDVDTLAGPVGQLLHRITLVHLTSSPLGGTSSPLGRDRGLTREGGDYVRACNAARILVDLAHAGKKTFWDALEVHASDLPPIVSHTGVEGVHPHWRNLDDRQVRAIADRGGVVGVIYHSMFLGRPRRAAIVDHLQHVIDLVGEDHAAIGTDYDGLIVPPRDLRDVTSHPQLVQDMLDRGWAPDRVRKVLGRNYLRVVGDTRP